MSEVGTIKIAGRREDLDQADEYSLVSISFTPHEFDLPEMDTVELKSYNVRVTGTLKLQKGISHLSWHGLKPIHRRRLENLRLNFPKIYKKLLKKRLQNKKILYIFPAIEDPRTKGYARNFFRNF